MALLSHNSLFIRDNIVEEAVRLSGVLLRLQPIASA